MRLFVTGATGFVGSHFARLALASGHDVVAARRPGSTVPGGLASATWLTTALDAVEPAAFAGCEALVHFAAAGVSPQRATPQQLQYWNVEVTLGLIEKAQQAGVRRIVTAGSSAEYGRSADRHQRIPPDAALLPTTHYAASKAACFVAGHAAAVEFDLEYAHLRIFSAFGEGQFDANFWPALRRAALAGADFEMTAGEQIRDYVAVEAVAEHFLRTVQRPDLLPGLPHVANVGSGQAVTMRDFARHWWQQWGAVGSLKVGALPYRANEVMRFVPLITD